MKMRGPLLLLLFALISCTLGLERKFVAEKYSFLDVFGTMLTGNHLPSTDDRYGGTKCAGCTILLILIESLSDVHGTTVEQVVFFLLLCLELCSFLLQEFEKLCSRLPVILQEPCDEFVTGWRQKKKKKRSFFFFSSFFFLLFCLVWAPLIIPLLEKKETADAVCLAINFCGGGDPGPVCRLLNPPNDLAKERRAIAETRQLMAARQQMTLKKKPSLEKRETPWGWLLKKLEYTFNNHVPFDDFDNDTFSTVREFRGWSWRGRDCNDFDRNVRPGRDSRNLDPTVDWNCNGIYGVNPSTGK
jgi:acyloxyacyl hydrolase